MDVPSRLGTRQGMHGQQQRDGKSQTDGQGASLEYDFELAQDKQPLTVALGILPTQDVYPARGLRIGVQIDNQPMQIVDARQGFLDTFEEYTARNLAVSKN